MSRPTVADALAAASRPAAPAATGRRPALLIAGGGGALGSAVLEALLAHGGFDGIRLLAQRPMASLAHGVTALDHRAWMAGSNDPPAEVAVMVIDRARASNGREAAFWQPGPSDLLPFARRLLQTAPADADPTGRDPPAPPRLLVVEPIDAARWPGALRDGLATLDEQAAAALGLGALVLVRPASAAATTTSRGPQRIADAVLGTLRLMTPGSLQPLRRRSLATVVARLAAALPRSIPGTRVLGPEALWQATQAADGAAWVDDWLAGRPLQPIRLQPGRL
jgi:hypothetical protein